MSKNSFEKKMGLRIRKLTVISDKANHLVVSTENV